MRRIRTTVLCFAAVFLLGLPGYSTADAALKALHPKAAVTVLQSPEQTPFPEEKDLPALAAKAGKGDVTAQIRLGMWHLQNGDAEKAGEFLKQPAEAGNAEAQYYYAFTIRSESFGPSEEALAWLEKSAARNFVPAILSQSQYVARDVTEGVAPTVALLRKAASLGDAQSAQVLGTLYFEGREVAHDSVAAYTWLYLARHGFSAPARPEKDSGRSRRDSGADDDDYASPLNFLAWTMPLDEIRRVEAALAAWPKSLPPDVPFARPSRRDSRSTPDYSHMATLLAPKDIAAINAAAEAGDNAARLRLGDMYLRGRGVRTDRAKGMALITQAAEAGDEKALFALAALRQSGEGGGNDKRDKKAGMEAARKIYEDLAAKGNVAAQAALGELLLKSGYEYPRDEAAVKADATAGVDWLTRAAERNSLPAMDLLARHHKENGDRKLAASWYERAAALGSRDALVQLVGMAEASHDAEGLYKWISIYSCTIPMAERSRARQGMLFFASDLTDETVLRLKKEADTWLHENPKVLEADGSATDGPRKDRDENGETALHRAARENDTAALQKLLAAGADVNALDYQGFTPLHHAITKKALEAAKLLLASGGIINAQSAQGETPLNIAAQFGDAETAAFLLANGADPDLGNPLQSAMQRDDPALAVLLVKAGADCDTPNWMGDRPLHQATGKGKEALLKALLEKGADPNAANNDGMTPLHKAARGGNAEAVAALLAAKADPNARTGRNISPLYYAVDEGQDAIAVQLLAAGADPNAPGGEGGPSLLHLAVKRGKPDLVKTLLDAKADPNAANGRNGETPLYAAADGNSEEVMRLLLAAGADPNAQDKNGETSLHRAVERGKAEMVGLLLHAKADPNIASASGRTALFMVFDRREPHLGILKTLLDAGGKTDIAGKYSPPPLHQAARERNLEAVRMLLVAKADPNFPDKSGKTALDMASDPAIVSELEKAGGKSAKADEAPLYDELGRPVNKAAELADAAKVKGKKREKTVHVMLNTPKEAEEFNKTVAEERKGNRSPYLTRAVLMGAGPKELAERIKAGADVNGEDPVFGLPLLQAIKQGRGDDTVRFLLENGANPNKGKPLLLAVGRKGELTAMLLKAGADPMTVDDENTPVLTRAADKGNTDAVAALLKAGAKPDARDKEGRTALYYAVWRNRSLDAAKLLLENGASAKAFPALALLDWREETIPMALILLKHGAAAVTQKEERETLAHWAVRDGSLELLEAAIKAKVPLTTFDRDGYTPLRFAVRKGNAAMVAALLRAGAPVNKSALQPGRKFSDYTGRLYAGEDDLLPQAVREGNEAVVKVLVGAGVNLNARENDSDRYTALGKSIMERLPGITAILLEAGAKTDIGDACKRAPLHIAVYREDLQSLTALLAKKADPNARDEDGKTPLYQAVEKGKLPLAAALLKAGADPNIAEAERGRSPLHAAGDAATAAALLAAKANPAARDKEGATPLHLAAHRNDAATVRLLLKAGADCNAKERDGSTPLILAAWKADPETVKALLEAGATVDAKGGYGRETALHRAAEAGNAATVRLLLAAKADPTAKDGRGDTPLNAAKGEEVVRLLEEAGAARSGQPRERGR